MSETTRQRRQRETREAVADHLSGEGVRRLWGEMAARVNPLVQRGSRRSMFRPRPGTPRFRDYVRQIQFARGDNALRRAGRRPEHP